MDNEIYQTPSVRPTCPVCRAQVDSLLCKKAGCDIWRCAICATDFVHPVPDDVALQAYYDSASYFQNGDGGAYENYDDQTRRVLPIFHQILEECEQAWVGRHLLDIGCAYGTHLQIAYDRGWKCHGIEVSKHARRIARERHGDKFSIVDCIENLPAQCFDLIVMLDVIEHLGDPYKLFDRLVRRGAIGPKTKVVITTPNARSFDAISDPVNWAYRYPPAHLVYYSSESLKRLLASVHFAVVDVAGIYPSLVHETLAYENEFFQNNDQVATYDGLLCIAWRMTFSEPSDQKNFAKLQNEILELEQKVVGLASARIHLRNEIEELLDQLKDREEQLRLITQSKLFRLRACIVEEPFSLRKLAKLGYLTLALLLPRGFKGAAASFARNLKRFLPWRNSWDEVGAYHVKIPVAVGEGRPRVMHAIGNFMTGGSSRLVVDLLERLSSHFEQEILTSFVPNPPAYVGLKVHEYRYLINSNRVLALLKKFKPDIVHVHYWGDVDKSWYGKIFEAAQRYGCKIIENINTPVEPFLADGIHRYVYVSDYVRRHFGEPDGENLVIHPGSDFSIFRQRKDWIPPENCIGMVYRLEPDKLDERALEPFIKAVQKRPDTRCLIVGGGTFLEIYKAVAREAGVLEAFEFTGYMAYDSLAPLYERMSVFVAPVWKESFGQVIPFAMSMNLPVAGYNVGALSEILGTEELLAEPQNSEQLSNLLIELLDNRERRLRIGEHNRQRAQGLFSVENMVATYERLYLEALGSDK